MPLTTTRRRRCCQRCRHPLAGVDTLFFTFLKTAEGLGSLLVAVGQRRELLLWRWRPVLQQLGCCCFSLFVLLGCLWWCHGRDERQNADSLVT